jgi:hypothetical protein
LSDIFEVPRPNGTIYGKPILCRETEGGCVECVSHKLQSAGYVQMMINGRMKLLHRYRFELAYGPVPEKYDLHHECENEWCVNPLHLQMLTRAQHLQLTYRNLKARGWVRPARAEKPKPAPKPKRKPSRPKKVEARQPKPKLVKVKQTKPPKIRRPIPLADVLSIAGPLNKHGKIPGTLVTVATPFGGRHLYVASGPAPDAAWVPGTKHTTLAPLVPR